MSILEGVEWEDVWLYDVNNFDKPHVLMIGDSILFGYKTPARQGLEGKAAVGTFATSKAIDNDIFIDRIKAVSSEMKPSIIHFNNCNHGFHLDKETYAYHYEKTINAMLEIVKKEKLMLVTGTSLIGGTRNEDIVIPRNEVVWSLAEKYGLAVDDLFPVIPDDSETRCPDGAHFTEEGYRILSEKVIKEVSKLL